MVRFETGREHTVHTPKGRVTAPRLILTVNGHIESFGFFERRLMHVFLYGSLTRRLTSAEVKRLGGEPAWALIEPIRAARPCGDCTRIASSFAIPRPTIRAWQRAPRDIARFGEVHEASFRARFPMLSDVSMEHRWSGHLCLSLNNAPAFGEIAERVYAACCCNGLGISKGTLGGMAIVDMATGTGGPIADAMLAAPKPKRLYPEPFMTLGAHMKLWWMQRQAGNRTNSVARLWVAGRL